MSEMVWVTEHIAVNLGLTTRVTIEGGTVRLLDIYGACVALHGDDAERFLWWFTERSTSSRND